MGPEDGTQTDQPVDVDITSSTRTCLCGGVISSLCDAIGGRTTDMFNVSAIYLVCDPVEALGSSWRSGRHEQILQTLGNRS